MRYHWTLLAIAMMAAAGCRLPFKNNLPPASMLAHPGPGVGGPGPGVMTYMPTADAAPMGESSQVAFVGPEGMMIAWDAYQAGAFDSEPLVAPGRFNFTQGGIYRLKLTNIPGRPGVELYPTIEVALVTPRTAPYLAHNAIPFQLTEEDFNQVLTGNFVSKVIYLPDAEYQELALAGVETLVSTRLDPGVDPIIEADRRGTILAIIRIGNKDLQAPGATVGYDGEVISDGSVTGGGCQPGGAMPASYISGVTGPEYGMPMSGTPIGLTGPPHIPLGVPAGLQKHVVRNYTRVHLPRPTEKITMAVKGPKISYPKPANHVHVHERPLGALLPRHIPFCNLFQHIGTAKAPPCPPADCPPTY